MLGDKLADCIEALLERSLERGRVENQEADCAPTLACVLAANGGDTALEYLTGEPELAIERVRRQPSGEPIRRRN
jgi:hypothetical protein